MKKTTLLGSTLAVTLCSAPMRTQATTPAPLLEAVLGIPEVATECVAIDDSTADAWNAGEYCVVSDQNMSTTSPSDVSVADDVAVAGLRLPKPASEYGRPVDGSGHYSGTGWPMTTKCDSAGGSNAASPAGFCLGSDINTSTTGSANFSVASGSPVARVQYLQVRFRDGSTLSGSRRLPPRADPPMFAECLSAGGSAAATAGEFCLGSDLGELTSGSANFSVANGSPAEGLHFLQVTFSDRGPLLGSRQSPGREGPIGTECSLAGGSAAATANGGGFCMVSDLSTPTTDYFANFSVANDLPVAGMHFLQIAFGDSNPRRGSRRSPGSGAPMGVECVSVNGSAAAVGNPGGSCLVSDLGTSTTDYFANYSMANGLAIAGMQYVQATFEDGNPLVGSSDSPGEGAPIGAECVSVDGSAAASGNAGGFCLVADRRGSTMGFANFSVANELPVAGWRFLQVPFGNGSPGGEPGYSGRDGAPIGVTISDSATLPFHRPPPPALVVITGHRPRHFPISDPTIGFKPYLSRHRHRHPFLTLWLGCESRDSFPLPNNPRWGRLHPRQGSCVRSRVRWGRLRL